LLECIKLTDQQILEEQLNCFREEGLVTPQQILYRATRKMPFLLLQKVSNAQGYTEDLSSDTDELDEKELENEGKHGFPKSAEMP
jgi:hypothetical protein